MFSKENYLISAPGNTIMPVYESLFRKWFKNEIFIQPTTSPSAPGLHCAFRLDFATSF